MSEENNKNFRLHYYGKVGCRSIEEKKSLEMLLSENPLDISKIAQFSLKCTIPNLYRIEVWKILLNISAKNADCKEFVHKERVEQYDIVKQALKITNVINDVTQRDYCFLYMYLLEDGIPLQDLSPNEELDTFLAIANTFLEISDIDVDSYWLAKNFYKKLISLKPCMDFMIEKISDILLREDAELHVHLVKIKALQIIPIQQWLYRAFAGILPVSCLERLWDKVIGGSKSVLAFVIVSMVLSLKRKLNLICDSNQIVQLLLQFSEETAEIMVCKSIELWQKYSNLYSDCKLK